MCFARIMIAGLISAGLGMLMSYAVAAELAQSLADIQKRAEEFLLTQHTGSTEPVEVQVSQLDPRLRLASCGTPLEAFQSNGARALGSTTVGIRCPGPQPWTVYISASVRAFTEVLVATRFLPQGAVLSGADLKAERHDLSALAGNYETVPARLIGKKLRRSVPMDMVISPQNVTMPPLITKGERVSVLARQAGIEVISSGIALSDAALGERLRVRNESSQKVIEGTVRAAQRIEVEM